jgi:hypothetical protein
VNKKVMQRSAAPVVWTVSRREDTLVSGGGSWSQEVAANGVVLFSAVLQIELITKACLSRDFDIVVVPVAHGSTTGQPRISRPKRTHEVLGRRTKP